MSFLGDYWDQVRIEITKTLVTSKHKQAKRAQKLSVKVMQIPNDVRDKFFVIY